VRIMKRRSAAVVSGSRSERLQAKRLGRTRLRRHRAALALVVLVGSMVAVTAHAVTVSCNSGISFSMNETVVAPANPQPILDVARVGDTIDYRIIVELSSSQCPFAAGTITVTHPDGLTQTLATGVSATSGGGPQTFDENTIYAGQTSPYVPYVVSDSDLVANGTQGGVNATSAITATGTQTPGNGSTFDDGANTGRFVQVIHPETTLTKSASPSSGNVPLPVTYTFLEANTSNTGPDSSFAGNLPLDVIDGTSIVIGDVGTGACTPILPTLSGGFNVGDSNTNGNLDPGETWTFTCSNTYSTVGSFVNTASAVGNAQDGREAGTVASGGAPHDEASSEITVTTTKNTPTLVTTPQPASGVVPQTLNDQATLSGLVNPVTSGLGAGTLTFNLYGPGDTTCSNSLFSVTLTASSGNGNYTTTTGPSESTAGTYVWLVSYSGDANNNALAAPSCAQGEQVILTSPPSTANLTPGFWKNHEQATFDLLPLFLGDYKVDTFANAKTILSGMGCGKVGALNCMAGMLLAAELNLAQGGSTCIQGVVDQANALLVKYGYTGVPLAVYTLDNPPSDQALAMLLHDELSAYNIDGVPTC
jgi:hypothetical protein